MRRAAARADTPFLKSSTRAETSLFSFAAEVTGRTGRYKEPQRAQEFRPAPDEVRRAVAEDARPRK